MRLCCGENLNSLLSRQRFVQAVRTQTRQQRTYKVPATFARCSARVAPMPASTKEVLRSTVIVESGDRVGTGVVISPDGLILTAAHVLDPSETTSVKFQSGESEAAVVVRLDEPHDVALLRTPESKKRPCLPIRTQAAQTGDDIFAIGSPLSTELSFSPDPRHRQRAANH